MLGISCTCRILWPWTVAVADGVAIIAKSPYVGELQLGHIVTGISIGRSIQQPLHKATHLEQLLGFVFGPLPSSCERNASTRFEVVLLVESVGGFTDRHLAGDAKLKMGSRTVTFRSRVVLVMEASLHGVGVTGNNEPRLSEALMKKMRSARRVRSTSSMLMFVRHKAGQTAYLQTCDAKLRNICKTREA